MALFSGKSVLVTGSAGGLGKAIAEAYLKAGAKVAICDINKSRLDSAREELSEHGTVFAHSVDVTDEESVKVLVAAVVQQFGSLDVLVSNAAVIDAFGELRALGPPLVAALGGAFLTETAPVGNTDKKTWDHVMAVNITGPFLVSKYAIKQFLVQEPAGGSIVNVGSVAGVRGWIAGAAYTASKHALVGLTKNIATFYARKGIRCNLVQPAAMTTNLFENMVDPDPEGMALLKTRFPDLFDLTSIVPLEHVASSVLYLSGDIATVNGQVISIDRGEIQAA